MSDRINSQKNCKSINKDDKDFGNSNASKTSAEKDDLIVVKVAEEQANPLEIDSATPQMRDAIFTLNETQTAPEIDNEESQEPLIVKNEDK